MSNNGIGVRDTLIRRLAEVEERDRLYRRVAPIVDCIRKMRVEVSQITKSLTYFATQRTS